MAIGNMKNQRGEIFNLEKALSLSLLHDPPESVIGDLDPETKKMLGESQVAELKQQAVTDLLNVVPEKLKKFYEKMFQEYENQVTPEAQLVKQIDYVEMILQALEYSEEKEDLNLEEFWKAWENNTYDKDVRSLLENIFNNLP
jgi:putative hydrolase of HD superfamily